jgi:hypothetical protein
MTGARISILLSHERSGSHLLGEYFGTLKNVAMIDEVCNPAAMRPLESPMSFFRFRHDAIQKDAKLLLEPTRERHEAFVMSFLRHLSGLRAGKNIVVDIKYGHVHNFELYWWPVFERPFLMQFCQRHDIGVVHLYRENVVEATVSAMIADERKVWHSWEAAAPKTADRTFRIPVRTAVRRARQLQRQNEWFGECTGGLRRLTVTYEALSRELGHAGPLDESLQAFAGGTAARVFEPRHRKVTRPLPDAVENYAELKDACGAAGLGGHLA